MEASFNAIISIMLNAFAAMMKIFLISTVGVCLAKFPSKDPILPAIMIKYLSKLANNVFVPCLIMTSLGSAITVQLLQRIGVLVLFCFVANSASYFYGYTFGRLLHGRSDDAMFIALTVAIGSPNAISLPIMVMQTMCNESYVKADYDDNQNKCFAEATSMLFVYSMGWHLMFWSYGFPTLKTIKKKFYADAADLVVETIDDSLVAESEYTFLNQILIAISFRKNKNLFLNWLQMIFLTPAMVAIFIGVAIGLIPYTQKLMFEEMSFLEPLGSAITTLGEPVVAINCLIMSASLAQVDFSIGRKNNDQVNSTAGETRVKSVQLSAVESNSRNRETFPSEHSSSKPDSISVLKFPSSHISLARFGLKGGQAQYARLQIDEDTDPLSRTLSDSENGIAHLPSSPRGDHNSEKSTIEGQYFQKSSDFKTLDGMENTVTEEASMTIGCNVGEYSNSDEEDFSNSNMIGSSTYKNTRKKSCEVKEEDTGNECSETESLNAAAPTPSMSTNVGKKIPPPTYGAIFALIICR